MQKALRRGDAVSGIRLRGYAGIPGMEPREGIRLGAELGQVVKYYGVGGVFHSDELPGYGLTAEDVASLRHRMDIAQGDAFVLVASPPDKMRHVTESIVRRIKQAAEGVPAETRLAQQSGRTVFMRPRPGSARMYPETDIPPVLVSSEDMSEARSLVPKPWEETVRECATGYKINAQLAEQLLDSDYFDVFGQITSRTKVAPAFAASTLCYSIRSMAREGLDTGRLTGPVILETFGLLDADTVSKESVDIILREVASGRSDTVQNAVQNAGLGRIHDAQIADILDAIIAENHTMIEKMGERAAGPLMGMAMSKLRGKAPGETVSRMIRQKIRDA